jgi:hypothetical protein
MPPKKRGSRGKAPAAGGPSRPVDPSHLPIPPISRVSSSPRPIISSDDHISAGLAFYDQLPPDMIQESSQALTQVGSSSEVS